MVKRVPDYNELYSHFDLTVRKKMSKIVKPELLIPAGNFEKLRVAIHYGADAVYLAGPQYGLRKKAGNFSLPELDRAIGYAHEKKIKIYVTVNVFPRNSDINGICLYLKKIEGFGADAAIISDPGVLRIAKKNVPNLPVHLSTQANTTNLESVKFWYEQGIKRVCVARELSLQEIRGIAEKTDMEIELFIHGAMCMSYSGRCFMSKHLVDRDANEGDCSQACRWEYYLMEEKRAGEYFPVEQDESGTYFFSSKDMCLIKHIPELMKSGATSFKIEGRMKSVYYTGMVTKIYREAIDSCWKNRENYIYKSEWEEELLKTSNRTFTSGFFNGKEADTVSNYSNTSQTYDFLGIVKQTLPENRALVNIRNKFISGDDVEWVGKTGKPVPLNIGFIFDTDGICKKEVVQPNEEAIIQFDGPVEEYDILRKKRNGRHPRQVPGS